jgi:ketosteroid isomerase-like protein
MTDKATSKPATSTGSYLTVYQKQDDGSWKAVEDFITPGPAPAAAAPAPAAK